MSDNLRVISLLPSATEMVVALGGLGNLVGVSHECDTPADVKILPRLSEPKFDPDGTSREIEDRVRAVLEEALGVYRIDGERLKALKPDVIITQSHCQVCGVSEAGLLAAVEQWLDYLPDIVTLMPTDLAGVWDDTRKIAEALGREPEGEVFIQRITEAMQAIAAKAHQAGTKPRVSFIEWLDPLMAGGNWMPELVDMAGGINLISRAGEKSPWTSFDDMEQADPDLIFVAPCGFELDACERDLREISQNPSWQGLRAVQSGQVFYADGHHYFNRPGPGFLTSLKILAEIFHPDIFPPDNFGKWKKW